MPEAVVLPEPAPVLSSREPPFLPEPAFPEDLQEEHRPEPDPSFPSLYFPPEELPSQAELKALVPAPL